MESVDVRYSEVEILKGFKKPCQISWNDHKKTCSPRRVKRNHRRRRKTEKAEDRWKRSGAMTSHHGCDEHYRNRTCPACFDENPSPGGCYWFDRNIERKYVKKVLEKRREPFWYGPVTFEKIVDKDLGIIYDERPAPREKYWYEVLYETHQNEKPFLPIKPVRFWGEREKLEDVKV